jgi:hypothetical protein
LESASSNDALTLESVLPHIRDKGDGIGAGTKEASVSCEDERPSVEVRHPSRMAEASPGCNSYYFSSFSWVSISMAAGEDRSDFAQFIYGAGLVIGLLLLPRSNNDFIAKAIDNCRIDITDWCWRKHFLNSTPSNACRP